MGYRRAGEVQEHGAFPYSLAANQADRVSKAPMYYRGANAALLLYDITNASSFDDVRGWLEGALWQLPVANMSD